MKEMPGAVKAQTEATKLPRVEVATQEAAFGLKQTGWEFSREAENERLERLSLSRGCDL